MPVVQQKTQIACEGGIDESTATESEAGETRTLVRHAEKCSAPKSFRRLILTGGAVGVLAVGMVTLAVHAAGGHEVMPSSAVAEVSSIDEAVSEAVVVLPANSSGYGCSNWEELRMAIFYDLDTAEKCMQACMGWAGCTGFGYQPDACDGDQQIAKGACYIWHGACTLEANLCWDNFDLPIADQKPATWALNEEKYGCANWVDAKVAAPTIEVSSGACGTRCGSTLGCIGFNFQPEECGTIEGIAAGACYIWNEVCDKEVNSCWNLYNQLAVTTLTAAYTPPAKTLTVVSQIGFAVGDTITIKNPAAPQAAEVRTLTGVSPLSFDTELATAYPVGSIVTTPLKPA